MNDNISVLLDLQVVNIDISNIQLQTIRNNDIKHKKNNDTKIERNLSFGKSDSIILGKMEFQFLNIFNNKSLKIELTGGIPLPDELCKINFNDIQSYVGFIFIKQFSNFTQNLIDMLSSILGYKSLKLPDINFQEFINSRT